MGVSISLPTVTRTDVDQLLHDMLHSSEGVSDLLFVVGKQPHIEDYGKLRTYRENAAPLTAETIHAIAETCMGESERLHSDLATMGSCDTSYSIDDARFRVNIYRQNGRLAMVMRKLSSKIPNMKDLGLPDVFQQILREKNGIIFVTGGTGSGKTTTLAALLNELNEQQAIHVVTLEDPIEFLHPPKKAIFSQRELGKDYFDFAAGLRAALRQAPKVILVGEIRDRETMEIAMTASETGHVVFSTLHTISAGQSINRVLGMFRKEEEMLVRQRLAETLRFVVSQRLVSKIGGGRKLITEFMGSNLSTREAILYGEKENRSFQDIIESGSTGGWHSFDQQLLKAYEDNEVSDESVMLYCTHKNKTRRDLDALKNRRGECSEHDAAPSFRLNERPSAHPPAPASPPPVLPAAAPSPLRLGVSS